MTTISFEDLGVVSSYGREEATLWRAHFTGAPGSPSIGLQFATEPEHRAIETLCEHFGADSCAVTPPTKGTA